MAANIITVANVAGQGNVVYPSAVSMGFPVLGILVQQLPTSVVIGSTTCVTKITVLRTGLQYFTSTVASSLYTTSAYTGSAKYSITSTIAAIDGNALPSTIVMGFPVNDFILETIPSTTYGTTACVTKITLLSTGDVYFTADTLATLAALTA